MSEIVELTHEVTLAVKFKTTFHPEDFDHLNSEERTPWAMMRDSVRAVMNGECLLSEITGDDFTVAVQSVSVLR